MMKRNYWLDRLKLRASKIILFLISTAIAFVPTELFLLLRYTVQPTGFWQNLVIFGLGFWALGFLQLVLVIIWAVFIVQVLL